MSKRLNRNLNWEELARQANWSVSLLAKQCDVSVRTLERHFLKTRGKTPKAWLAEHRQVMALKLLDDGLLVKEASTLVGYQHATTFSREFKKLSGQCPNTLPLIQENKPLLP